MQFQPTNHALVLNSFLGHQAHFFFFTIIPWYLTLNAHDPTYQLNRILWITCFSMTENENWCLELVFLLPTKINHYLDCVYQHKTAGYSKGLREFIRTIIKQNYHADSVGKTLWCHANFVYFSRHGGKNSLQRASARVLLTDV